MKDIPGKDLLRFAIREQIMTYFKGRHVKQLLHDVPFIGLMLEQETTPGRNGRQFNYVRRENDIRNIRRLDYKGNTIAKLSKAPDCITINKMLKTIGSTAARELAKDMERTMRLFIPYAKVEFADMPTDTTPARLERAFSEEAYKELASTYKQIRGNTEENLVGFDNLVFIDGGWYGHAHVMDEAASIPDDRMRYFVEQLQRERPRRINNLYEEWLSLQEVDEDEL